MGSLCCTENVSKAPLAWQDKSANSQKESKPDKILLLLGVGSSGKSTLFRSLQIVHRGNVDNASKYAARKLIRDYTTNSMETLIKNTKKLHTLNPKKYKACYIDENDSDITFHLKTIKDYDVNSFFHEHLLNESEMVQFGQSVGFIWNLKSIQCAFKNRGSHFFIEDNTDHFLNKATSIFSPEYICHEQDYLKVHERTVGMIDYSYNYNPNKSAINVHNWNGDKKSIKCRLIDIGGTRSDRPKWVKYHNTRYDCMCVCVCDIVGFLCGILM